MAPILPDPQSPAAQASTRRSSGELRKPSRNETSRKHPRAQPETRAGDPLTSPHTVGDNRDPLRRRKPPRSRHRRHRLAARRDRPRPADDPGPGPVLRRHGPHEERPEHADDELRVDRPGHGGVAGRRLLARLRRRRRRRAHRRPGPRRHGGPRPGQRARHGPHAPLRHLPAHLRDHHRRADQRRDRRPGEVRGMAGLRAGLGAARIRSRRALGVGPGRLDPGAPRRPRLRGRSARRDHLGRLGAGVVPGPGPASRASRRTRCARTTCPW